MRFPLVPEVSGSGKRGRIHAAARCCVLPFPFHKSCSGQYFPSIGTASLRDRLDFSGLSSLFCFPGDFSIGCLPCGVLLVFGHNNSLQAAGET